MHPMIKLIYEHLPLSMGIGLIGMYVFHDPWCIVAAILTGWLIDVDHLFDFAYYAWRHYPKIDYSLIRGGGYFKQNQKVFVPLHAWEWSLLMLMAGVLLIQPWLLVAGFAHAMHLLQDQRKYHVRPLGYSILSRSVSKFTLEQFCKDSHAV